MAGDGATICMSPLTPIRIPPGTTTGEDVPQHWDFLHGDVTFMRHRISPETTRDVRPHMGCAAAAGTPPVVPFTAYSLGLMSLAK